MKLIINVYYGGFEVDPKILNQLNVPDEVKQHPYYDNYMALRTNQELINLIESGVDVADTCSELEVIELPDNMTDYKILEYDGVETVYYLVDGKIHTKGCVDGATLVEIPNNATDYRAIRYDGAESVAYAVDGKIYLA